MTAKEKRVASLLNAMGTSRPEPAKAVAKKLDAIIYPDYFHGMSWPRIITTEQANEIDERHFSQLRGSPIADLLVDAIRSGMPQAQQYAIGALTSIGDERSIPVVIELMADQYAEVRAAAASSSWRLKDKRTVPPLIALLADDQDSVVETAIRALGHLRSVDAVPHLKKLARSDKWRIRQCAIYSLGDIKDASALPLIRQALKDKHRAVRKAAKGALGDYDLARRDAK